MVDFSVRILAISSPQHKNVSHGSKLDTMSEKTLKVSPYGTWTSELTTEVLNRRSFRLSQVRVSGDDTYWVETRSAQEGRNVLLRRRMDGRTEEVLPMTPDSELVDVRTKVHDYGGKAYTVIDNLIVVSHGGDGCLYKFDLDNPSAGLRRLTPKVAYRFADMTVDPVRGVVFAVLEDHTGAQSVANKLVSVPLDGSAARESSNIKVLWNEDDFVASPALSNAGEFLAFITWNRPQMNWNQAALHVAPLTFEGDFADHMVLLDDPEVSVTQPRWSLDDNLIHVDDSSGWANLYRTEGFVGANTAQGIASGDWKKNLRTRALHPSQKAFSAPEWRLGLHSYDNLDHDHLVAGWSEDGHFALGAIRLDNGQLETWETGWAPAGNVCCDDGRVVLLADSEQEPASIVQILDAKATVIRRAIESPLPKEDISSPQFLTWKNTDGSVCHGFFFVPTSASFKGPKRDKPPLIVTVHDGPTSANRAGLNLERQYWTNRGFAVLDVNFRGSTGYGRAYRDCLLGNWGIYDVDDVISGVRMLIEQGKVDKDKIAIRGSSTGATTALLAAAKSDLFTAVCSRHGICDLENVRDHAHKFASEYLGALLGATEDDDPKWKDRSPITWADQISASTLFIHGTDDPIVPVDQVRQMAQALQANGNTVESAEFTGEGHRLAKASSIGGSLQRELDFYRQVWGLKKA